MVERGETSTRMFHVKVEDWGAHGFPAKDALGPAGHMGGAGLEGLTEASDWDSDPESAQSCLCPAALLRLQNIAPTVPLPGGSPLQPLPPAAAAPLRGEHREPLSPGCLRAPR